MTRRGAAVADVRLLLSARISPADDWPAWRHDAARTAFSPADLPDPLHLHWVREFPPPKPAWPDQPRMPFDAAYRPVVAGTTLFVGTSVEDAVAALDTRTGAVKWRFLADGPVRLAPAAWEGRVYFVSDDGHLYCLDGSSGALVWKFRGGPRERRVLGNGRLISLWPARGGPVVSDGAVYFSAGLWPFMGIFLHALDARTGRVLWSNEGDGSIFIQQPHRADSFAGVAPQGALAAAGDRLLVPGGRSVPACYDRLTGKLLHFRLVDTPRRGGSDVAAMDKAYFAGGAAFDMETRLQVGEVGAEPVIAGETVYYAGRDRGVVALKAPPIEVTETTDKKGKKTVKRQWPKTRPATLKSAAWRAQALIRAGGRLYGGSEGLVWALDPEKDAIPWKAEIGGVPLGLAAADGRLFVSTGEGRLYCFGAGPVEPAVHRWVPAGPVPEDAWTRKARAILDLAGVREGYCVLWGAGNGRLAEELARQGDLPVVAVDPDARKVEEARSMLAAAGLYGERAEVHAGDPATFPLPPFLAGLMVSEEPIGLDREAAGKLFSSLRPYGGIACLPAGSAKVEDLAAWLPEAEVKERGGFLLVARPGAPPGAGDWTHEHADAANTRVSRDRRVKAPLGLLWFGGSSNEDILPRHGHGPQPQAIDGRLFIEGMDLIRAMDIYTGRVLWETELPGVGSFFNNVLHQPGANASGSNYVSTPDGIYVVNGRTCTRLDPATGRVMSEFRLPGEKGPPLWGCINVHEDLLVGGAEPLIGRLPVPPLDPRIGDDNPTQDLKATISKLGFSKFDPDNYSSSRRLVAMDRHDGKVRWTAESRSGFRHNGICIGGGRLYCIDRLSGLQLDRMKKEGTVPAAEPRLVTLDLRTGRELWSAGKDVFGTWLSYSAACDILVEAGRVAKDTISDEPKGMRAWRASDGAVIWAKKDYQGPAMIHGDTILMAGKACDLRTGAPRSRFHPLTGLPAEWTWTRQYGCNTPAASRHLLTFRSGAAGYFDLARDGGTGNFGGFRSSCTNNLVAAGGVLCVPDYTRTCTCSYQIQASVALAPMPEAEMWTYFGSTDVGGTIRRVGVNLGAPGDRRAEDGTLWVEHPGAAGKSPSVPVRTSPETFETFRLNALSVEGAGLPWVAASGARGLRSLSLTLDKDGKKERLYDVRLHFAEPDDVPAGRRVFDVSIQGREALRDFDVVREAGGPRRAVVKEFPGIPVKKDLVVEFSPVGLSEPILCGIEASAGFHVPVFRYALERWPADPYEAAVMGDGTLDERGRALVEVLERAAGGANVEVRRRPAGSPGLVLRAAEGTGVGKVVWAGPLEGEAVGRLLDSPARREVARRILEGESAVWVLLEGGDKGRDDDAAERLQAALGEAEATLVLPSPSGDAADRLIRPSIPLRLAFSIVRVSREDPAEEVFVRMLLGIGPDPPGRGEPMAFPVFGRGRSLGALVGPGIDGPSVTGVCARLAGGSSGEAKGASPGADLLFTAEWNSLFQPPAPPEAMLKPRAGTDHPDEEGPAEETAGEEAGGVFWLGITEAAAALVLAGLLAFLWVRRRRG